MKVIHRREEERERRKGGEDRTASEVENTTYPGDGGGGGADIFIAQLSPRLRFNLSFHCRFWNPLIKIWYCGTTPLSIHCCWPENVHNTSLMALLPFPKFFFFFFKLCMLGFSCPTSTFLLSSCCWCNHILTVIYSLSRKIRIETHISYNWDISIRVNVGFVGFSLYLAHDTL